MSDTMSDMLTIANNTNLSFLSLYIYLPIIIWWNNGQMYLNWSGLEKKKHFCTISMISIIVKG